MLEIGTRIYYTGDQANNPGKGTITAHIERTQYGPFGYQITMDDGRIWRHIYASSFNKGPGRRFMTMEEHQTDREKARQQLMDYLKSKGIAVPA